MQPIDIQAPADTRSCLRYCPVASAVTLDTTAQTQYRGVVNSELAQESDFQRLSMLENDTAVQAMVYSIVQEAFLSDEVQQIQLKTHPPEPLFPDARSVQTEIGSKIESLALQHPSLLLQHRDTAPNAPSSADDGYARLFSYIQKSARNESTRQSMGAKAKLNPEAASTMPTSRARRQNCGLRPIELATGGDNKTDSKLLTKNAENSHIDVPKLKRVLVQTVDGVDSDAKRQRLMSDIAAKSESTTTAVADSTRSCAKPDKQSRFAEALDDYLAAIFQEEDQISENSGEKGVYFRRIPQMHGETVVMNKRAIRQVRTLLALCTEGSLAQLVPDANVSRTVDLLTSAVEAADSMGLADMIKCGAALDSETELSAEFCHKLDLALSISCLGLEAAALVIDMAASGKASNTACTGDSLHTAVSFFKECLTSCVVPLLDLTPKCGLAEVFKNTSSSLNGRLQAFLGTILAAHEPVISLVRRPLLAEQDIISLVFASIGITFSSSELLAHDIDTNTLESIRRCSQSLLRQVFEFHVDQRTWMLEEILASLIRLPTKRRAHSSSRIAGGKSVQSITILLLKLLQGTAHLPEDLTAGFEGGVLPAKEYRMMHQKHRRAVETATSSSDFTVRYLIGRCIKRDNKASANEAEYRTLLEAFIDDCIVLLGHPQWPAAELVVRIYSLHMLELLDDEKTDIGLKTLALDSAAQVASHIAYEQQALEDAAKAGDGAGLDIVSPASSLESINRFRDASTSLLEYLQSKAVGSEATNAIPLYIGNWATMLIAALLKGNPRTGKPDGSDNQCDDDVDMGEDLDLHLDSDSDFGSDSDSVAAHKGQESTSALHKGNTESESNEHVKSGQSAADGLVANFNDPKHRAIQGCLKDYMNITHRSNSVMPNNVTFASAAKAARSVFLLLPLYRSFDMLLTRVILALSATQVTLRSKALRALNQIASQRASVLYQVNVKYAINHRLQDSSPQVREAAIDLIGKHIAQNPELTDQYYEFVSVRVLDKGPSVRKRVMKIMRDIYVSSTDTVQLVDIGVRILQRTGDDERSIRELATKTLHELWFTSVDHVFVEDEDGICGGEAAGDVFNLLSPDSQREMLNRVRVMTGVMEASRSRELSELMAGLFEHVTTKVSTVEADEALLVIRCIIEALFEQLLKSEEVGLGSVAGASFHISPRDGTFDAATPAMFSTAACLRFISALSDIAPDVVGQHAEMLSAYLKMTNAAEEDVLYSVLTIFSNVLLKIPHPSKQFLDSLEADLISLLSSSPQGILAIVVPCLCTLVDKITWNYGKLVRLFRSCALQLYREKQRIVGCTTGNGGLSTKNLMRFIVLAGLTCRHFDFDQHRQKQKAHFKDLDQIIGEAVPEFLNEMLLFFASPSLPPPVQLAAIQMLGQMYINRPPLALEPRARALMDQVFADGSNSHKLQVVRNFLEYLRADARLYAARLKEDRSKPREVDVEALVGNSGQMSAEGVGASLMQTYLDRIIDATFFPGAALLRTAGFEVISLVLEQGLAHPLKCMPALIALGTSSDAHIRNKSLKLHQDMCFKYASFIHSRDIEGMRLAYEYQVQVHGSPGRVIGYSDAADVRDAPDRPVAYLQPLYSLLRSKRAQRNDFLTLLVKTGDYDSGISYSTGGGSSNGGADVSFVRFVAENLAALDYKYLDEVLHVIYQISAVIASTGLNLYHQFEAEADVDVDVDEAGTKPATTRTGSSAQGDDFKWRQTTEASACVGVMFTLREFLMLHYNISELRCSAYNPGDSSGVRDKPVSWHAQGGGGQGRIVWGASNPYAVQRMVSAADYSEQRAQYRQLIAGSLETTEGSLNGGTNNRLFESHDGGGDDNNDDEDDALLNAEDMEFLSMHDFES